MGHDVVTLLREGGFVHRVPDEAWGGAEGGSVGGRSGRGRGSYNNKTSFAYRSLVIRSKSRCDHDYAKFYFTILNEGRHLSVT